MEKRELRRGLRALCAAAALAAGALGLAGATGCSSTGLHLPGSFWPRKTAAGQPGVATASLPEESLKTAAPYAPPPPPPRTASTIDGVVASVDGNPITLQDVKTFNAGQSKDASAVDPAGGVQSDVPDEPNAKLKALITQQLIQEESQKYASKVDEGDVDRFIQGIEERNHLTDEQLRAQLQAQGMSYAQFRATIRKQVQAMAMFQHEVRDKVVVSDADIEAYYKEHPDEFNVAEEKYHLAQILIAAPKDASAEQVAAAKRKAEEVRAQAAKGKDFADLARQYSDDDSKTNGGELGQFSPAELNDDIAAGIKNVKVGDVSGVIRTKYGFHIIKIEDHQVPGGMPLSEVKGEIRQKLQADRSKDDFQQWIDRDLVKEHYVETAE
jgi:peptidyl-prolyl cis-trans isomerase SurA